MVLYFIFRPKFTTEEHTAQFKSKLIVYYARVSRFGLVYSLFGVFNVILYSLLGYKFFAAMYCVHLLFTSLEMPSLHKMAKLLRVDKEKVVRLYKGEVIK